MPSDVPSSFASHRVRNLIPACRNQARDEIRLFELVVNKPSLRRRGHSIASEETAHPTGDARESSETVRRRDPRPVTYYRRAAGRG